jgi:hypothetical protein
VSRILLLGTALLVTSACHKNKDAEGPMERAGKHVDDAAEKTGEALGTAAEKTGDALERAGQKLKGGDASKPAPQPAPSGSAAP